MPNKFELPVSISINPSKWLKIWIYLIHLGSVPVVMMSGMSGWLQVAIMPAVLVNLYLVRGKCILLKSKSSVTGIFLNSLEEWWLTTADGHTFKATLLPMALVSPLLTVLCFQSGTRKYSVILTSKSAASDDLRRLRVRLRYRMDSIRV